MAPAYRAGAAKEEKGVIMTDHAQLATGAEMNKPVAPGYCLENSGVTTQREWRRYKRAHLKQLRNAFEEVRRGCLYAPISDGVIGQIDELIAVLEQRWSPKEWGD